MSRKNKSKKSGKLFVTVLKVQIFLLFIIAGIVGYYYVGGYASTVSSMKYEAKAYVSRSSEDTFRQSETSMVYDAKNRVVQVLKGEKDVYYLEYEDIPVYVTQALISIEDKKYYKHKGIDYKAVIRAAYSYVEKQGEVTQGGSTITQQLARTIFLSNERTWTRKVEEMFIAIELEKKYSKEDILEFYINNVYFGNGYYGIQAAANGYFNKNIDELNLSQICFLISIPNNPTSNDPLTHMDNTLKRRDKILDNMVKDKVISKMTADNSKKEAIVLERPDSIKYDYIATYANYCATKTLMEMAGFEFRNQFEDEEDEKIYAAAYNESYNQWNKALFTGGYRIYTSLDMDIQALLQSAIDDCLVDYQECSEDGIYELQSAAVCIDNYTGMVKAIVGGRCQDLNGYTLNRAYQSYRQPGSSIKPLIVYTPVLERGYNPDTIVVDEPIEGGPANSSGNYSGEITLRQAVMYSKNTIAWNLFEELTPKVGLQYLKDMGFAKIVDNDYYQASSLGGMTYGVSPLEMAKAYATLANDGYMRDPNCVTKITDAQGNIIYEATNEETSIYKENAARYMTNMLQSVLTDGTAKGLTVWEIPCAGKTGTTDNNRDGWFVGYSSYYTTSVWVGYDLPKKLPGLQGSTYPAVIWQTFMKDIHENLTPVDFLLPVTYIGTEEEEEEVELDGEEGLIDNFEEYEPETRTITQTFEGTVIPEGAIPEGATNVTIVTVTE